MIGNRKKAISWLLFAGALAGALFGYQSCGTSVDVFKPMLPPIGEVKKLPATPYTEDSDVALSSPNVLIRFILGSKALDYQDDVTIKMYEVEGDEEPLYEFTANELAHMHEVTHCEEDVVAMLNNATLSDGIFCNNAIDLKKVKYIEALRPNKSTKTATSFSQVFYDDHYQLTGIELVLF